MDTTSNSDFAPLEHREKLLQPAGLSVSDTGGEVVISGEDPIFPSAVRLGAAFSIAAMAAAVGTAAIWRRRGEKPQDLSIDIAQAAHGINPELTFQPTINDKPYANWMGNFHPFGVFPYLSAGYTPPLLLRVPCLHRLGEGVFCLSFTSATAPCQFRVAGPLDGAGRYAE